jgi:hypothetical protein
MYCKEEMLMAYEDGRLDENRYQSEKNYTRVKPQDWIEKLKRFPLNKTEVDKKSFAKLKSFTSIICQEDFAKKAYLDIDKTPKELKKYLPRLIKFLSKNENKLIEINTKNPRIWIDLEKDFSILANEDWFSEIHK